MDYKIAHYEIKYCALNHKAGFNPIADQESNKLSKLS